MGARATKERVMGDGLTTPESGWGGWLKNQFSATPLQYLMYFCGCVRAKVNVGG